MPISGQLQPHLQDFAQPGLPRGFDEEKPGRRLGEAVKATLPCDMAPQ